MDILAHALWAGIGVAAARRRWTITRRDAALTVVLAVAPDAVQLFPLVAWMAFGGGTWDALTAYSLASPDTEPLLPAGIAFVAHHLHCTMHSAIVALVVTAGIYARSRRFWIPLLGWWSHIFIDVFTHSADFYPSPVFYPLTMWGFDGVAWNARWFMAANYAALAAAAGWLFATRRRSASDLRRSNR